MQLGMGGRERDVVLRRMLAERRIATRTELDVVRGNRHTLFAEVFSRMRPTSP